jgi:hypothetical protein
MHNKQAISRMSVNTKSKCNKMSTIECTSVENGHTVNGRFANLPGHHKEHLNPSQLSSHIRHMHEG